MGIALIAVVINTVPLGREEFKPNGRAGGGNGFRSWIFGGQSALSATETN
jgi:hypothetical protein